METIGYVTAACGAALAVALFVTHDPPSGYNMGTGDSWIPFWVSVTVAVLGVCAVSASHGVTP